MNDFIDKAAWGLNAIFSNGDGFPRTCFLFCGGITDEKAYKRLLPTRQAPSNVWYSAYPHLTTKNIANNEAIRRGLSEEVDEADVRRWLRRFGCGQRAARVRLGRAQARQRALGQDMPSASRRHPGHHPPRLRRAERRVLPDAGHREPRAGEGLARGARAAQRAAEAHRVRHLRQRRLHAAWPEAARPPRRGARDVRRRVPRGHVGHGASPPDPRGPRARAPRSLALGRAPERRDRPPADAVRGRRGGAGGTSWRGTRAWTGRACASSSGSTR